LLPQLAFFVLGHRHQLKLGPPQSARRTRFASERALAFK